MRIWDVDPAILCRQHLLGEHRELHGLWNVLVLGKKGYSQHPETLRWVGRLPALRTRHEALVIEMERRGYRHQSPLLGSVTGATTQDRLLDPIAMQMRLLEGKPCDCPVLGRS